MEEELGKVGVNFSEDKRSLESWKVEYPFAYVFYSLKHHIEWLFGNSEQPLNQLALITLFLHFKV